MKTILSVSAPAEVEAECLAVVVLDRSTAKDQSARAKPEVTVESGDAAIRAAAADIIGGGEVSGKMCEATL